ncbi:GNAT family N-acetyltransferase [Sphingobacterium sp. ML3W]|uniref:GNAT family N-acetyltransferase n=1 Tax=Sphingobacterium sp. ML3W TaxID=1538644 RepID=UPI00249A01D1|nr:GNAT family N-acetyltransferase [Sphingobacterium sp. ML3W]WFA80311.1 GNAT family N-acetyltransferase [Sphingobacterium sp. ML3W]
MVFREAKIEDIAQIQISDPALVSDKDCEEFLFERGKGWGCEIDNQIVGFAIADLKENNIWALFLTPESEGKEIGRRLQKIMLDWYFSTGKEFVWLGTAPNTGAKEFYTKSGWVKNGFQDWNDEYKNPAKPKFRYLCERAPDGHSR